MACMHCRKIAKVQCMFWSYHLALACTPRLFSMGCSAVESTASQQLRDRSKLSICHRKSLRLRFMHYHLIGAAFLSSDNNFTSRIWLVDVCLACAPPLQGDGFGLGPASAAASAPAPASW